MDRCKVVKEILMMLCVNFEGRKRFWCVYFFIKLFIFFENFNYNIFVGKYYGGCNKFL